MPQLFEARTNIAESDDYLVRAVGGTTAVTKVEGKDVTISYVSTGRYRLTWAACPGVLMGATYGLQATTPGNIAGHTVIFGAFTAGGTTLDFYVYNASDALHDLAALEWVTVKVVFAQTTLNNA